MPPTNNNQLAVDLVVNNADQANKTVQDFAKTAEKAAADINQAGASINIGPNLDKQLNTVQHRFADIRQQLFQISTAAQGVKGFDGLGKAADRVYNQLTATKTRLAEIQAQAAKTTNAVVLERLRQEAIAAGAELDKLQNKINRVSAGRQAAVARAGANAAPGAGRAANAAAIGSQFLPSELQDASQLAQLGIGAGSVAVGGVAAAGFLFVKVSERLKELSEQRLKNENEISATINKEILGAQQLARDFEREQNQRVADQGLANAGTQNIPAIQAEIETLKRMRDNVIRVDPEQAKEIDADIIKRQDRIDAIRKKSVADADAAFEANHQAFLRSQESERAEVDKGIAKVKELRDTYKTLFEGLFAAQGENNPFVKLYSDADAAIEKTRLATRGLSKELQDQAAAMTATDNANKLFAARLDNKLQADDFRATADRFRNAGDDKPFIDPRILATPGGLQQFAFNQFAGLRLAGSGSDVNLDSLRGAIARSAVSGGDQNASIQERFDKQLAIIQSAGAENEQQRAEADRRLLAIGDKLDPTKLTAAQRDAVASAAERQAVRLDNQEKDAKAQQDAQAKTFESIDKNLGDLLKIAQSDGLTGVIRIIDQTGGKVDVDLGKRPNDDDVAKANQR